MTVLTRKPLRVTDAARCAKLAEVSCMLILALGLLFLGLIPVSWYGAPNWQEKLGCLGLLVLILILDVLHSIRELLKRAEANDS